MFDTVLIVLLVLIAIGGAIAANRIKAHNTKAKAKYDKDLADYNNDRSYHRKYPQEPETLPATWFRATAGVAAALAAIVAIFSCATIIPPKQVGIPVTFGKAGSPMSPGLHFKAPWTNVENMDGAVQTDDNVGDAKTPVRLGNQSVAYVYNNVRWSIRPQQASELYQVHRSFDKIGPTLEEPELAAALNAAFRDYDPLAQGTDAKTLDQIAKDVKTRLEQRIGDRLVIESVTISKVDFDERTQGRIDAYQTEIGNTRIAEQRKRTAAADAEANRVLSSSVSNDPNVLVSRCLDQVAEMIDKGQQIPVGFSCWPGSAADKPAVIVGGAAK